MRIGQLNNNNYSSFMNLLNNMKTKGSKGGQQEDTSMYISKFEYRFKPTNINFVKPNWDDVLTKKEPAMSDDEFEEEIRAIAREHAFIPNGKHVDMTKYYALGKQYISAVSPDRKSLYEESMKMTGGKMNAAKGFFNAAGQLSLMYNSTSGTWGGCFDRCGNGAGKAIPRHIC